jgi:hypothetical protein
MTGAAPRAAARACALASALGACLFAVRAGPTDARACTLMAVAGPAAGGKVLVAKTRDRRVRFPQVLVDGRPAGALRYLGIAGDRDRRVTSGVNERGLVAVNARVSTRAERDMLALDRVLSSCATIDGAIDWLGRNRRRATWILLLADPGGLAVVESAPGRPLAIERVEAGTLVHTNHYTSRALAALNTRGPGRSSTARLARARELMDFPPASDRTPQFTPGSLIAATRDHAGGPSDLSVCRHPERDARPGGTLSAAVYEVARGAPPRLFVALGQPCVSRFVPLSFDRPIPRALASSTEWRVNEVRRSGLDITPAVALRDVAED